MQNNGSDINYLFEPASVAIVGASHDKGKIGYKIVENIIYGKFKGEVYPINPKGGEILGRKVYKNISEIEGHVEMAVISIPATHIFECVKECATKGVKMLVIITSGFSEVNKEGAEEEKKIVSFAREHGMRVLGPNIFGVYSCEGPLNATFGPKDIIPGHVAISTQSGALGIAVIGITAVENLGLSSIISNGNKADLDEADLLEYLIKHDQTKVIMMYLEGIKNGEKFIASLKKASKKKPIVVIKTGRSKRGAQAAASHTGALAASDEIFEAIMKQCSVLRAESVKECLSWCKCFANSPLPPGDNAVIITNGGGIGVLATDAAEKYNVNLYDDVAVLKEAYSPMMPYFGSYKNPIDLTGQAGATHYSDAFKVSLENPNIHAVLSLYCETALFDVDRFAEIIKENFHQYQKAGKPIVFCLVGGEKIEDCVKQLKKDNVPVFTDPYEAVSAMGALYAYHNYLKEASDEINEAYIDTAEIEKVIDVVKKDGRNFLLAHEAMQVMKAAGVTMPQSHIAKNPEEAARFADEVTYPVVMKVVSKDILHKSDAGGVALNLQDKNEVIDAFDRIMKNAKAYKSDAVIEGIEVCEMVKQGPELIVGARKDASLGPIVMCGMGGIYVEVMKDVAFRSAPLNRKEALKMLQETKSYKILAGARGQAKKDVDSVVDMIIKLATIIRKCPAITDIEVNPVVVYEKGLRAVDARILISK